MEPFECVAIGFNGLEHYRLFLDGILINHGAAFIDYHYLITLEGNFHKLHYIAVKSTDSLLPPLASCFIERGSWPKRPLINLSG